MHIWTVLLASGRGSRIQGQSEKKQFLQWRKRPLYWHSVLTFCAVPRVQGLVITFPAQDLEQRRAESQALSIQDSPGLDPVCVPGGSSRQASVRRALAALPQTCTHVLIHDAARPFVSPMLISRVISALVSGSQAVVPAIAVPDTVKQLAGDGQVHTLDRHTLQAVQTPQGFLRELILSAHVQAEGDGCQGTDDASLVERLGHSPTLVDGEEKNRKITTNADLSSLQETAALPRRICTGWGYDVHRFGPGRPMKLGGIPISNGPQVQAHSDGDVLIHALIDAILGCLGQGDIGDHFPDTDPAWENANSGLLLSEVLDRAARHGLQIDHVDLTLITQIPKITPWKSQMTRNLQGLLGLGPDQINLKATTEEHLGFTGEKQGIKAVAQVVGSRDDHPHTRTCS